MSDNNNRGTWKNNTTFILAAIGSAVGLGNAWRFPGVAYQNGGGAFLIPYIIALIFTGIPVLTMEVALGKKRRGGAPKVFAELGKKYEFIGWFQTLVAVVISFYYAVIFAWVLVYTAMSFKSPWEQGDAKAIFFGDVLHCSSGITDFSGSVNPTLAVGVILAWALVWLCIRKGVKSVGGVVKYTVTLSVIFLLILIARAATLPGAVDGLRHLVTPDWGALANIKVWGAAFGQVFFSLSLAAGVMTAYGSYLPEDENTPRDCAIIGFSDLLISMIAGVAAFATLGYLAHTSGTPIDKLDIGGIMLTFVTYPTALAEMPGGHISVVFFSLCFFLVLLTLAIDSVFSMTEALTVGLCDKFGFAKSKITGGVCVLSCLVSFLFITTPGAFWVDLIDRIVGNYFMIAMAIIEVVCVGWLARNIIEELNEKTGCGKLRIFSLKYVCPVVFTFIFAGFVAEDILVPYGGFPKPVIIGAEILVTAAMCCATALLTRKSGTAKDNDNS